MNETRKAKRKPRQRRPDGGIFDRSGPRGEAYMLRYGVPDAPDQPIRKWHYVTVRGTRDQAKAELARRIEQLQSGTHVDPQKLTVAQWVETWTRDYAQPTVSAKTFERYSELLRLHVVPYL